MKTKTFIASLTAWLSLICSFAQVNPEKEKDILRYLELIHQKEAVFAGLPAVLRPLAERIKNLVPAERADEFVEVLIEKMIESAYQRVTQGLTVPVMDARFTHDEIRDLIRFWESPEAQRYLRIQIQITRDLANSDEFRALLQNGQAWMADILKEMEPDFPELAGFRRSLLSGPEQQTNNAAEMSEVLTATDYANRTANLKLTVPEGWRIHPEFSKQMAGGLVSPDGSLVLLVNREAFEGSLDEYRKNFLDRFSPARGFETLSEKRLVLDGKPALRLVAKGGTEGERVRQMTTAIAGDGVITLILAVCEERLFEAAQPTLEAISDSYRTLTRIVGETEAAAGQGLTGVDPSGAEEIQSSQLAYRVDPVYPEEAKRAKIAGRVLLKVLIDEQGNVGAIEVLQGHPLLTKAAIEAVRQWGYTPALVDGKPAPVIATVTVNFEL